METFAVCWNMILQKLLNYLNTTNPNSTRELKSLWLNHQPSGQTSPFKLCGTMEKLAGDLLGLKVVKPEILSTSLRFSF